MLAIIPARRNSKGLKRKNIKVFDKKSLISHTIEIAISSKLIRKVLVTSDDERVLNISKKYNVDYIINRPKRLSGDKTAAVDVYLHALNYLENHFSYKPEEFIILQPTSPLRTQKHISEAYNLFKSKKSLSVISCTQARYPEEWKFKLSKSGIINKNNKKKLLVNRQNFYKTFYPNGVLFIINTKFFKKNKSYYSKKTYGYIMNQFDSIDIDDIYDFKLAEAAYCLKKF